jgi:hypothetical protein
MAAYITQAAKGEQQPTEDEQVDRNHPLDGGYVSVKGIPYDRQDRVDHAGVQGGHESACSNGNENPPITVDSFGQENSRF